MYGLPELHLFGARTIGEWFQQCAHASFDMDHGLVRVIAELFFGEQTEKSIARARGWLMRRSHCTTEMIFELVAEKVHPLIPIDKSPSLVYNPQCLQYVRALFPDARYIYLTRHPRGHGESVMRYLEERAKLGPIPPGHWLVGLASYPYSFLSENHMTHERRDVDPQRGWYALNQNICEFLESIPDEQKLRIRGEDLLSRPADALGKIVRWMQLRDDPVAIEEMMHPERSPYAGFGPLGARFGNDRSFLRSPTMRPVRPIVQNLEGPLSWREDGRGFLPEVKELARQFGY